MGRANQGVSKVTAIDSRRLLSLRHPITDHDVHIAHKAEETESPELIAFVVIASVDDAYVFEGDINAIPKSNTPGLQTIKAQDDNKMEVYLEAISSEQAKLMFLKLCAYSEQTPSNIRVVDYNN